MKGSKAPAPRPDGRQPGGAAAGFRGNKSGKDVPGDAPVPLGDSLKMAWSLRPVYLAAFPSALGLLGLAIVQGDLLIAVTYLAQRLLDSFTVAPGGTMGGGATGGQPLLTGWLTGFFTGRGGGGAPMLVTGMILVALLAEGLSLFASQWRFRISQSFRARLQRRLVASMLRASGSKRDELDTAACQMMFSSDSGGLGMFLIFGFLGFFEQIVKLGIVTAGLFQLADGRGWQLALVLVPTAFVFKWAIMKAFIGWEQRANHRSSGLMMESQRAALGFFPLMPRLVYLGGETIPAERLQQAAERSAHGNQRLQLVTNLHGSVAQILTILALPLAALVMLRMSVSPGQVVQLQGLFGTIIGIVGAIVSFPSQIIQYAPALKRVTGALAVPDPGPRPEEIESIRGTGAVPVVVKDLRFRYGPGLPPQIDGVSFEVPAGKLVCIVGKSGSGKSTLARLLMGERLPEEGSIKLGEWEVSDWPLWWRREVMAFLPAEVGFFRDNLIENLRFGREGIPASAIAGTAEALGLSEALRKYGDESLHTPEAQLSTGEQRRVGVARLLLGGQKIWILDEPLANLDPSMMGQVAAAISAAARGRTTIVITHDPEYFDSEFNIFLRDNRVDGTGSHRNLMDSNPGYRELCERPSSRPPGA